MACCGAGATARNRANRGEGFTETNLLMASRNQNQNSDMVLVRYTGRRVGAFTIWGSTKPYTQYRINPKAPIFYVYQTDLYRQGSMIGVLDYMENNNYVFELYSLPTVEPLPEIQQLFEPVNNQVEDVLDNQVPDIEPEPELSTGVDTTLDTDSILATLNTLQAFLDNGGYTLDDLAFVLETERNGRNRTGAITRLTTAMDQYDGTALLNHSTSDVLTQ